MDAYGSFSSKALDSYANEALGVMKSHLPAIKFSINDKKIEKLVRQTLEFNNMFTSSKIRDDVRLLSKYGEIASVFQFYPNESTTTDNQYSYKQTLKESISNKESCISNPLQPEQIHISYISPANYDLEACSGSVYKLNASGLDNKEYLPYEFSYGCLRSEEFFPRGESVLERARIPFEVLSVSEQLINIEVRLRRNS